MLIAMATGTGKTFTMASQIYRLLESKQFCRILFLVDRRALAVQAVREFASFATPKGNKFTQEYDVFHQRFRREDQDDDRPFDPKMLPESYLTESDASKTFVYISTIQRMSINLFGRDRLDLSGGDRDSDDDAGKLDIPIHAFDLIVADECHRGYTASETGVWMDTLNLHTILRLPRGTFTPYSQGVKANVIFFQKDRRTEEVWIFDARSNVPGITKKERPLSPQHFEEFGKCYGADPSGRSQWKDLGPEGRFRRFPVSEIKKRDYKLDLIWLKDESLEDSDELPEPRELASQAIAERKATVDDLQKMVAMLKKKAK